MPLDSDNDVDNAAWSVVNFLYITDRDGFRRQSPDLSDDNKIANALYTRMVAMVRSSEPLNYNAGSLARIMGLEGVGDVSEDRKVEESKVIRKVKAARRKLGFQK